MLEQCDFFCQATRKACKADTRKSDPQAMMKVKTREDCKLSAGRLKFTHGINSFYPRNILIITRDNFILPTL